MIYGLLFQFNSQFRLAGCLLVVHVIGCKCKVHDKWKGQ
jgi:hypothetical protein